MTRLKTNMYDSKFLDRPPSTLFGFRNGQMRGDYLIKNAGWYNRAGQKLGHGDLSVDDFETVAIELVDDELFIVLGEYDSLLMNPGAEALGAFDVFEPGLDYILAKAYYVIAPLQVFVIDHDSRHAGEDRTPLSKSGLMSSDLQASVRDSWLSPDMFKALVAHS